MNTSDVDDVMEILDIIELDGRNYLTLWNEESPKEIVIVEGIQRDDGLEVALIENDDLFNRFFAVSKFTKRKQRY